MKRLFAVLLALMLIAGIALAETAYDVNTYVSQAGYKAESSRNKSGAVVCDYFEPAKGAHTLMWSDAKNVYTVTASRNRDRLQALYADLVSLYSWDSCAYSVEDVVQYGFNVTEGSAVKTYKTQTNYAKAIAKYVGAEVAAAPASNASTGKTQNYVLNNSTKKFHLPDCADVSKMKKENRQSVRASRDELIAQGYDPCQHCNP